MTELLDRFIKYVKIDTQSAYGQAAVPSTEKQRDLAAVLADELRALGAECAAVSESGCVYGKIPANCEGAPSIGFSAHIDTSPDLSGKDVKPRVVANYDGGDVTLNEELGVVLSPENFPHMRNYKGWDLVVTDGTTLLGADDKAGLAEIMTMAQYFHDNPGEKHGEIQFFFPTDEEIGCLGAKTLDKNLFNPKFAYTLDGGPLGEITYETFNAAAARVDVTGVNIHPGLSKNQMINAILIANEFINMLPPAETPSHTEGYEGYYHVLEASGEVELATLRLLLRDHDAEKLEARKQRPARHRGVPQQGLRRGARDRRDRGHLPQHRRGDKALLRDSRGDRGGDEGRGRRALLHADARRHRRHDTLLRGNPLPEHLHRRPQLPRPLRIRAGAVDGENPRTYL